MLEVFQSEVVPHLEALSPRQSAEELFAALVEGNIPASFAEVDLMAATGWSWQTLLETPAEVVQKMAVYLAVRNARENGTHIRFEDQEDVGDGE